MSPRALPLSAAALVVAAGLSACNALIGTRDLTFAEPRDATVDSPAVDPPDTAAPDAPPPEKDAAADVAVDASCTGDLSANPKHCGRCGHDCQGGQCEAGMCKAVVLFPAQAKPLGVTLLNGVLYWTNSGTHEVRRGLTDGTGEALFAKSPLFEVPWGITNDGTSVYFAAARDPGGVFKCPASDCTGTLRQLSSNYAYDVAVVDGTVYFTSRPTGTLSRVRVDGTSELPLATINNPFHLAVDATHSYVTSNEFNIIRVAHAGGPPFNFADNSGDVAGGIFVDATRVYWNYAQPGAPGSVFSRAKGGGAPTQYANMARNPLAVLADAERVYWVTLGESEVESERVDGKLLTCPIAGCAAPTVLVGDLRNGSALAQDDRTIYLAEIGAAGPGAIRKIAKP